MTESGFFGKVYLKLRGSSKKGSANNPRLMLWLDTSSHIMETLVFIVYTACNLLPGSGLHEDSLKWKYETFDTLILWVASLFFYGGPAHEALWMNSG